MPKEFTPTEVYLLALISNNDNQASYDWEAIKTEVGMGSVGGTRNKLKLLQDAYQVYLTTKQTGDSEATVPSTPKSTKRKTPASTTSTPKSVKTPRVKKAKVTKKESVKEEVDGDVKEEAGDEDVGTEETSVEVNEEA